MSANDIQVGGNHYKKNPYQHWDFVIATGLHYILGVATKYPSRWREKNGAEDLCKSKHYIQKAKECDIYADMCSSLIYYTKWFCKNLHPEDASIIHSIVRGQYDDAIAQIDTLLADIGEADERYTNQG